MALLSARLNIGRLNAERLNWIGADTTAPTVPQSLTATATSPTTVLVSWQASSDFYGVQQYRLYRCTGAACTPVAIRAFVGGITYTDHADPLTTYRYQVRAEDASGNLSGPSNLATATTPDRARFTNIVIKVGGVWTDVSQYARVEAATVTQALNEVADTAAITFGGSIPYPLKGTEIQFADGAGVLHFAGMITAVQTIYQGRAKNVAYECDCLDYTWMLNSRKVSVRYNGSLVSSIINALVSSFAPAGFTCDFSGVSTNPILDEITFTNEELAQAISRTCERGGLYWYVDYGAVVRVFNSAAVPSAGTIDDTHPRTAVKLAKHEDAAAIATRVIARGGGAGATSDAAIGQTTLPVDDSTWYATAGGIVECGPQRLTYTGIVGAAETGSTIGKIGSPPADANYWGAGGNGTGTFQSGNRWVGVTNVTANGETVVSPLTLVTFGPNSNLMIGVYNALHPPDRTPKDPAVKAFRAYVGTSGGGPETLQLVKYVGFSSNWVNSYGFRWDNPDGYALCGGPSGLDGTINPPAASTAGTSALTIPAGSTTLAVDDLAPFPASGWAEAPGGQLLTYTGKSAASGPGTLTGIPASGIGSITAAINSGTIRSIPHLIGIPASGAGSIVYPIKAGDEVFVVVIRADATAIAALAAATGGDGIREEFLTDGRLALAELTARADATLTMRKQALVTVNFESRDPLVTVGKTITFNTTLPPIAGTFLIQRVTISQFQARGSIGHPDPLRVVEASSRRYTFDDLVQQIKLLGRIN